MNSRVQLQHCRFGRSLCSQQQSNTFASSLLSNKSHTAVAAQNNNQLARTQLARVTSQNKLNIHQDRLSTRARKLENIYPLSSPTLQSQMINGLRSQLLSIKSEVSKLLVDKPLKNAVEHIQSPIRRTQNYQSEFSVDVQVFGREGIFAPYQKVDNTLKYLHVENDQLKLGINGLKRRYLNMKHSYEQQVNVLNKKVRVLELTLQTNEQNILAYKLGIDMQMDSIKKQLTDFKIQTAKTEMIKDMQNHQQKVKYFQGIATKLEEELHDTRKVYTDRLIEYQSHIQRAQVRLAQKVDLIDSLEIQLKTLKKTGNEVEVQTHELQSRNQEKIRRQQIERLENEAQKLKIELMQTKSKQIQMNFTKALPQADFDTISTQVSHLKGMYDQKAEQLQKQEILKNQRVSKLKSQIDALRFEMVALQSNLTSYKQENSLMGAQIHHLNQKQEQQIATLIIQPQSIHSQKTMFEYVNRQELTQAVVLLQSNNQRLYNDLSHRNNELEIARHEIQQLNQLYCQITEEITIKERQATHTQNLMAAKLNMECNRNDSLVNKLESMRIDYRTTVQQLKDEIRHLMSRKSSLLEGKTFDEVLKTQIEEIDQLKIMVNKKQEQVYQLRDHIACNRSQVESIRAELEIERLKAIAERKNLEVGFQVETQKLKNGLQIERKTTESLVGKLRALSEESRSKDQFIQRYIMGKRISPEEKFQLDEFFRQYRLEIPFNELKAKLTSQHQQIKRLQTSNINLILNICTLKEKLHSFEKVVSSDMLTIAGSERELNNKEFIDFFDGKTIEQSK